MLAGVSSNEAVSLKPPPAAAVALSSIEDETKDPPDTAVIDSALITGDIEGDERKRAATEQHTGFRSHNLATEAAKVKHTSKKVSDKQ